MLAKKWRPCQPADHRYHTYSLPAGRSPPQSSTPCCCSAAITVFILVGGSSRWTVVKGRGGLIPGSSASPDPELVKSQSSDQPCRPARKSRAPIRGRGRSARGGHRRAIVIADHPAGERAGLVASVLVGRDRCCTARPGAAGEDTSVIAAGGRPAGRGSAEGAPAHPWLPRRWPPPDLHAWTLTSGRPGPVRRISSWPMGWRPQRRRSGAMDTLGDCLADRCGVRHCVADRGGQAHRPRARQPPVTPGASASARPGASPIATARTAGRPETDCEAPRRAEGPSRKSQRVSQGRHNSAEPMLGQ